MKLVAGTFNGVGSALYFGIGFIPDFVEIFNLENAEDYIIRWDVHMRSAEYIQGILLSGDDDGDMDRTPLTTTGVEIYRGGDLISSASTTYLVKDPDPDKRDAGTGDDINKWTLGSSTNKTGNWNAECSTTYVGEGSRIAIDSGDGVKWTTITALTSNGEQANEVTLNEALKSGKIAALHGMYDYAGAAAGTIMPAGFKLNDTTLNVSGEMGFFKAGEYSPV